MSEHTPRSLALRSLIRAFIRNRLTDKLDKLAEDDPKRDALIEQYHPPIWLADAARRVAQLQVVTHPLKASHPDARGSSLFVTPESLPDRAEIGTHALKTFAQDVVGNAAALDVYKFLKLEYEEKNLLEWMLKGDSELLLALSDDPEQAAVWCEAFCGITKTTGVLSSHTLVKQIYWPVSPDEYLPNVHDNGHFHLLSVLHSSPMAHCLYGQIQTDRFGEEAKAARQARRDGVHHPHGYHDYPLLAEEKKGGTKPQNISQLNSERKGSNYLLASLPPLWENSGVRPLYGVRSLFDRFGQQREVRRLLRELREFLGKLKPEQNNMHIRNQRDAYLEAIFSEFVQFGAGFYNTLPAGWTADPECVLPIEEQCWLDPSRAEEDADFNKAFLLQDWPEALVVHFSFWLNRVLGEKTLSKFKLELGEENFDFWKQELAHDFGWQSELDGSLREQDSRLLPSGSSTGERA